MRIRILAVLLVAVAVVPLHARAATPVTVTAVNRLGQAIMWAGNTIIIKPTTAALPVKGTLTCISIKRFASSLGLPFGPGIVPLAETDVRAAVKAGGVKYYVFFQSFAQRTNNKAQAVTVMGISKSFANSPCGANPILRDAAGLAVYR